MCDARRVIPAGWEGGSVRERAVWARICRVAATALIVGIVLSACQGNPTLNGIVTDNFGHPLDAVEVIASSGRITSTDGKGAFHLPYAPGKLDLQFVKDGYAAAAASLDVKSAQAMPPVQLFKLLKAQGVWLVNADDYRSLNTCTMSIRQDR